MGIDSKLIARYVAVIDEVGRTTSGTGIDANTTSRADAGSIYEGDISAQRGDIDTIHATARDRNRRGLIDIGSDKVSRIAVGGRDIDAGRCSVNRVIGENIEFRC